MPSKPAATTPLSKDSLRGVLLPFTTPFKADDDLDVDGLRDNISKWNKTGIVGYVALGSTGERVNLNEREYLEVIEIARAAVPPDLVFIVGVGQQSTRGTIAGDQESDSGWGRCCPRAYASLLPVSDHAGSACFSLHNRG